MNLTQWLMIIILAVLIFDIILTNSLIERTKNLTKILEEMNKNRT